MRDVRHLQRKMIVLVVDPAESPFGNFSKIFFCAPYIPIVIFVSSRIAAMLIICVYFEEIGVCDFMEGTRTTFWQNCGGCHLYDSSFRPKINTHMRVCTHHIFRVPQCRRLHSSHYFYDIFMC